MNLQHENERFFRRLNRSSSTSDINKNGLSAVVFKMVGMTGVYFACTQLNFYRLTTFILVISCINMDLSIINFTLNLIP